MKTPARFVFEFDEAQLSGKVLSASDAMLLTRMVASRDRDIIEDCAQEAERVSLGAHRHCREDAAARIRALSPAGTATQSPGPVTPDGPGTTGPGRKCETCGDRGRVLSPLDGGGEVITDPCPTCRPAGTAVPEVCGTCGTTTGLIDNQNMRRRCPACSPGGATPCGGNPITGYYAHHTVEPAPADCSRSRMCQRGYGHAGDCSPRSTGGER